MVGRTRWFGARPRRSQPRIALLIPTFNRSVYVDRQLSYLAPFDRSFYRIFVLDGSTDPDEASANRGSAGRHGVDYQWYDSAVVSAYDRIIDGTQRAQTDYVQVVPDDDYFSDLAFRRHAQMLDESRDAVGAYGHSIGFKRIPNAASGDILRLHSASYREEPDYVFDHPVVRMHYAMLEKSRSGYYCLYRTGVALRLYSVARSHAQLDDAVDADAGAGGPMDPRSFYFGDFLMTALPVIMGKKLNSGRPSVAFEMGQSFDGLANPNRVGPPRQHHYMLPQDESFRFAERLRRFVDCVIDEYKHFHACPDEEELRQFLTSLTMVAISSTAFTGDWIRRYNKLIGTFSIGRESLVQAAANFNKLHPITDDRAAAERSCGICSSDAHQVCATVRAGYAFAVDHIAQHHDLSRWQVLETGPVELEFARTMFSFERPWPHAARGVE